ncbi:MAG: hypothetical protein CVV34_04545 [Methanomicrobiales archaeon HGW-Methanomicrobiales-5]|nr:MAG: hypothetical protein CVV34_04545 [Methanomicrobiales archaeon HGW-Methanomicrobiales-5]
MHRLKTSSLLFLTYNREEESGRFGAARAIAVIMIRVFICPGNLISAGTISAGISRFVMI